MYTFYKQNNDDRFEIKNLPAYPMAQHYINKLGTDCRTMSVNVTNKHCKNRNPNFPIYTGHRYGGDKGAEGDGCVGWPYYFSRGCCRADVNKIKCPPIGDIPAKSAGVYVNATCDSMKLNCKYNLNEVTTGKTAEALLEHYKAGRISSKDLNNVMQKFCFERVGDKLRILTHEQDKGGEQCRRWSLTDRSTKQAADETMISHCAVKDHIKKRECNCLAAGIKGSQTNEAYDVLLAGNISRQPLQCWFNACAPRPGVTDILIDSPKQDTKNCKAEPCTNYIAAIKDNQISGKINQIVNCIVTDSDVKKDVKDAVIPISEDKNSPSPIDLDIDPIVPDVKSDDNKVTMLTIMGTILFLLFVLLLIYQSN
jgi:hypothetical protein